MYDGGDLEVLYEHLATSTWHQRSSVCGVVGCSLEGGCQQVCLDIELRWKGKFPHVSQIVLMSLNVMQGHVGVEFDGCTYCLD
jgi:hypothetical protein